MNAGHDFDFRKKPQILFTQSPRAVHPTHSLDVSDYEGEAQVFTVLRIISISSFYSVFF